MNAATFFFARCQELGVRMVVVTRHAAYAARVPRSVYDDLALSGSSIGWRLRNAQRLSMEHLWARVCSAQEAPERKGLPERCDRKWFIETFCDGKDDPTRSAGASVWHLVRGFAQYDSLALIAAVPALRERYYVPRMVPAVRGSPHVVVGCSEHDHNVRDVDDLVRKMCTSFHEGIMSNHKSRSHVIVCLELRHDNLTDVRLFCVMLRALWDQSLIECIGLVVTLDTSARQRNRDLLRHRIGTAVGNAGDSQTRALGSSGAGAGAGSGEVRTVSQEGRRASKAMADAIEGERLSIESLRMKTSRIFKSRAVAKQMFAKSEGDDEIDDDDILQRHTDECVPP